MTFAFAGVCLLDNPYAIDGIYDYQIPPHLAEEVVTGAFVTVPFGVSNRRLIGLVVELRDCSKYKEHKLIESVCPDTLALNEEMLRSHAHKIYPEIFGSSSAWDLEWANDRTWS